MLLSLPACSARQREQARAKEGDAGAGAPGAFGKPELLTVTDGLRPAHLAEAPLLEKIAHIPAPERGSPGRDVASRVYRDGSYYLLVSELEGAPVSARWSYLSALRSDGVERLEALFARACGAPDSRLVDDLSQVRYHVSSTRCTRTFVNGLPSDLSPIREVDTIINETMQEIPKSP